MLAWWIRFSGRYRDHFRLVSLAEMIKLPRAGFFVRRKLFDEGLRKPICCQGKRPGFGLVDTRTTAFMRGLGWRFHGCMSEFSGLNAGGDVTILLRDAGVVSPAQAGRPAGLDDLLPWG